MIKYVYDDGGRASAGYGRKAKGDCVCRAISIATQRPYLEIHALIDHFAKSERKGKRKRGISNAERGVYSVTVRRIMAFLGWQWVPLMSIGSGCQVHLDSSELPQGRIVATVSKHEVCIIDGVIHDIYDPSRDGTRCVYGYYEAGPDALSPDSPLPIALTLPTLTKAQRSPVAPKSLFAPLNRRANAKPKVRYTSDGWRIFSREGLLHEFASLIPNEFRPYFTGFEIYDYIDPDEPITATNTDVFAYFKNPVGTSLSDVRYFHCCLADIENELLELHFEDHDSVWYEDFDEEHKDRKVQPISAPFKPFTRDLLKTWRKPA